jgi:Secretion system C-terminal sorting domain
VQGMAHEKLLYEFGLSLGDTLQGRVINLINTTVKGNYTASAYPVAYNFDSVCANLGPCDTAFVYDSTDAFPPYYPISYTFNSLRTIYFLPDIGTVYSAPYIITLDVYGQHYFLKQLTSQGQVLYFNPGLANAVVAASPGSSLRVSPNPAMDWLRVTSAFPMQEIRLMDGLGRVVLSKLVDGGVAEATLDVGDLPRGLYWLQARGEAQSETRAVMVR